MVSLKYVLPVLLLLLLFLLYRHLPNRRVFLIFCLTLLAAISFAIFAYEIKPQPPAEISVEEKNALLLQQQIFADWYTEYKKGIDQMDHNWQQYHRILSDFKADNISIQTTYLRLTQLEIEASKTKNSLRQLNPPKSLNDNTYDLLIEVMKKTRKYATEQHRTISLTRAASDPAGPLPGKQEEQSRLLEEVMIRESPSGLFTAAEISSIRDSLSLPDEN